VRVGFLDGLLLLLLARRVVLFALLLERGHFDRDTTIVASYGHGGVHLTFAIVASLGRILSLSRLSFLEFDRTDRARFHRSVQFVLIVLGANDGDARRVSASGQLDARDERTIRAILVLIVHLASFLHRPGFARLAAAAARARCGRFHGHGSVQILTKGANLNFLERANRTGLRAHLRIARTRRRAAGAALLTRARIRGGHGRGGRAARRRLLEDDAA